MRMIEKSQIEALLDTPTLFAAIKKGFCDFEQGRYIIPPVSHIHFDSPPGDAHIKYGYREKDDFFVIKISTGFYANPELGLPSSQGMMLVFSAATGEPLGILQDQGLLTDVRTAIAGALATQAMAVSDGQSIGVIGTGIQARLQLRTLRDLTGVHTAFVWGRRSEAVDAYVADMEPFGIRVIAVGSVKALCAKANVIITTTPSAIPLVRCEWVRAGTHITAVGADADGKQELDEKLVASADILVADSIEQSIDHGEFSHAARVGTLPRERIVSLGAVFLNPALGRANRQQVSIADLTGVALQDIEIAKSVWLSAAP